MLHIQLLGDLYIRYGDKPVPAMGSARLQSLLAYLLWISDFQLFRSKEGAGVEALSGIAQMNGLGAHPAAIVTSDARRSISSRVDASITPSARRI